MIHLTINGKPVEVLEGSTIMEAAEASGIRVPSLCHMKGCPPVRFLPDLRGGSGRDEEPAGVLYGKGPGEGMVIRHPLRRKCWRPAEGAV